MGHLTLRSVVAVRACTRRRVRDALSVDTVQLQVIVIHVVVAWLCGLSSGTFVSQVAAMFGTAIVVSQIIEP